MNDKELIEEFRCLETNAETAKENLVKVETAKEICRKNYDETLIDMKEKFGVNSVEELEALATEKMVVISDAVSKVKIALEAL